MFSSFNDNNNLVVRLAADTLETNFFFCSKLKSLCDESRRTMKLDVHYLFLFCSINNRGVCLISPVMALAQVSDRFPQG